MFKKNISSPKKRLFVISIKNIKLISYHLILIFLLSLTATGKNFDTEKAMEKYEKHMQKRYVEPVKKQIKVLEKTIEGWEGLRFRLNIFREACYKLYDPTVTPFNVTNAKSGNPQSFTASTSPGSRPGDYTIHVQDIAKADKISSKASKKDTKFKGSVFTIKSKDQEVKIDFSKGGTLRELYNIMEKAMNKIFSVSIAEVDDESEILLISGLKTGEKNKLALIGDKSFFREIGFIRPPKLKKKQHKLSDLKKRVLQGNYTIKNEELTIDTESRISVTLKKPVKLTKTTILEAEIQIRKKIVFKEAKKKKPPIGHIEKVEVGRIKLFGESLIADLEEDKKKRKPQNKKKKLSQTIDLLGINDKSIVTNSLPENAVIWKKIKLEVGKELKSLALAKKLLFNNEYKDKTFSIRKVKLYDPFADNLREDYNYIDRAQDARFLFNGVEIKRDKNEVEKLIRGVVLKLLAPSNQPSSLKIERDIEKTIAVLQKFVDEYNNVMLFIKNVRELIPEKSLEEMIKDEELFDRKTFEEKEYAKLSGELFKGLMRREFLIRSMKNKIRQGMVLTPYPRTEKREIKFLFQIGIKSPNISKGSQIDRENLKTGYLYVDKKILEKKLETNYEDIKHLFAHAKKGSIEKNNGIAVNQVKLLDSYAKKSVRDDKGNARLGAIESILNTRNRSLTQVKRKLDREVSRADKKIAKFRQQVRTAENARKEGERRKEQFKNTFMNQRER
ncbi:MAG: flagellar filament capping protein FliD [Spirochaetota bacterium]|nr:flagellar filament capping protein FliD [Spirochaetota bacterium]